MSDDLASSLTEVEAPATPSRRMKHFRGWVLIQLGFTAFAASGMWWLVSSLVGSPYHWLHSLFLPALVVLVIGLFILRDEFRWASPSRRLRELIRGAREGQIPIEELSTIQGGLSALVPVVQELLRDLKAQKLAVAELHDETRQRVASRTDALERQLGTLRQQAARDGLTGLYNRRMFDSYLPKLFERCAGDSMELSVLVIDVDNFKVLNDTLGHSAGDKLLRDIGQIIRSGIRDQDASFRVGGDEFVVVMPGADAPQAAGLSRRLTELVDALTKPLRVPRQPRLSIGIASLSETDRTNPQEMIDRADRRLYETKSARRSAAAPLARSA